MLLVWLKFSTASWRKLTLSFFCISTAPHFTFPKHPPALAHSHTLVCLVNMHLHTAVSHRHSVVGQRVTGHLAVIGAAGGGKRAHMAGIEWVSSLVWSAEVTTTEIRLILMQHHEMASNRWMTFQFCFLSQGYTEEYSPVYFTEELGSR